MNRLRRSGSEPGGSAAPPASTSSAGKPPERPALPPYLVADDDAPADLRGGGCVIGWGLPYGKPTPERFELQWGFALTGGWTLLQPPVSDCRRLTVRPVGRPKDGIGERWCCRLEELKPKTKYAVQVRGVSAALEGEWSKTGKIYFEPPAVAVEKEATTAEKKSGGRIAARIPFRRRGERSEKWSSTHTHTLSLSLSLCLSD